MMHYLSVHDFVWINTTVTGQTLSFDYQRLEACMAAQYGYGESSDALLQSANLLQSLLIHRPFAGGNRRTAFIAVATFLNANGFALKVSEEQAADLVRRVEAHQQPAQEAVREMAEAADITLRPGVPLRQLVTHVCNEHTDALKRLTEGDT